MFKDIFELEDAKLEDITNAQSEEEIKLIEEKYLDLLKELEIRLESEISGNISSEQDEIKKEVESKEAEEKEKIDAKEKELEEQASNIPEEEPEEQEQEEIQNCITPGLMHTMEEDFKTLTDSQLAKKYNKFEHKALAKFKEVSYKGKEIDIIANIRKVLV